MHEARPVQRNWLRQVVFPLLIAVVLVVGALLVCGSSLIRIEDVYINRILAGTYGVPDWRVQEMNPVAGAISNAAVSADSVRKLVRCAVAGTCMVIFRLCNKPGSAQARRPYPPLPSSSAPLRCC